MQMQSAMGRRQRDRSRSEERKDASANPDASGSEDGGAARAAARSIRRNNKQRGLSAVPTSTFISSIAHGNSKPPLLRGARRDVRSDEDEGETSEDALSNDDDDDVANEVISDSSVLSELSEEEVADPQRLACEDELMLAEPFVGSADSAADDEWKPGVTARSAAWRTSVSRSLRSILKMSPLMLVRRFLVDVLDDEKHPFGVTMPGLLGRVIMTLDDRKSVTNAQHS
jgi:hypothetical protein